MRPDYKIKATKKPPSSQNSSLPTIETISTGNTIGPFTNKVAGFNGKTRLSTQINEICYSGCSKRNKVTVTHYIALKRNIVFNKQTFSKALFGILFAGLLGQMAPATGLEAKIKTPPVIVLTDAQIGNQIVNMFILSGGACALLGGLAGSKLIGPDTTKTAEQPQSAYSPHATPTWANNSTSKQSQDDTSLICSAVSGLIGGTFFTTLYYNKFLKHLSIEARFKLLKKIVRKNLRALKTNNPEGFKKDDQRFAKGILKATGGMILPAEKMEKRLKASGLFKKVEEMAAKHKMDHKEDY